MRSIEKFELLFELLVLIDSKEQQTRAARGPSQTIVIISDNKRDTCSKLARGVARRRVFANKMDRKIEKPLSNHHHPSIISHFSIIVAIVFVDCVLTSHHSNFY
jgi:hypothetical protein